MAKRADGESPTTRRNNRGQVDQLQQALAEERERCKQLEQELQLMDEALTASQKNRARRGGSNALPATHHLTT
jgi:phage-related minor tail protein